MKKYQVPLKFFLCGLFSALCVTIVFSCSRQKEGFVGFLYSLAEIPEGERQQAMDDWISKVEEFPIVENTSVFFIYNESRDMPVFLSGEMNGWAADSTPLLRIVGTSYYYCQQQFLSDSRLEYKFNVNGTLILDPLNHKTSTGGFGENSLLMMPDYHFPYEELGRRSVDYTSLDTLTFDSELLKNSRKVFVFRHKLSRATAPVIIFNDGGDYLLYAQANTILDNMISDGLMPPCIAFFVNPVDRMKEYRFDNSYLNMLFNELLPWLMNKYGLQKNNTLFMGGASLGGLVSFYALKDYHQRLNGVFSQSGTFWVDSTRIVKELQNVDLSHNRLFYDYGTFENQELPHSRLKSLLTEKKTEFSECIYHEGHDWGSWKGHLEVALKYLLQGTSEK